MREEKGKEGRCRGPQGAKPSSPGPYVQISLACCEQRKMRSPLQCRSCPSQSLTEKSLYAKLNGCPADRRLLAGARLAPDTSLRKCQDSTAVLPTAEPS